MRKPLVRKRPEREVAIDYVEDLTSDPMEKFVEILAEGVVALLRKEGALKRTASDADEVGHVPATRPSAAEA